MSHEEFVKMVAGYYTTAECTDESHERLPYEELAGWFDFLVGKARRIMPDATPDMAIVAVSNKKG